MKKKEEELKSEFLTEAEAILDLLQKYSIIEE